jgi:PAS domain-containing protein
VQRKRWPDRNFSHPGVALHLGVIMADHDEIYGEARADRLAALLRSIAERIRELDREGQLLRQAPELLRLLGEARSELFHYEVRSTYDTPEVAEHRRLVDEARAAPDFLTPDDEDDDPWRHPPTP